MGKDVFVIAGGSDGIGEAAWRALAGREDVISVGMARREERLADIASAVGGESCRLDIADPTSRSDAMGVVSELLTEHDSQRLYLLHSVALHEPSTVVDDGVKRYSLPTDVPAGKRLQQYRVNVVGALALDTDMHALAQDLGVEYRMATISSHAASEIGLGGTPWEELGNWQYAPEKRLVERYVRDQHALHGHFAHALRFPFVETRMAKALLEELSGVEPFVHVDGDFAKPLKPRDELFLPAPIVGNHVAWYLLGEQAPFTAISEDGVVREYGLSVPEARKLL